MFSASALPPRSEYLAVRHIPNVPSSTFTCKLLRGSGIEDSSPVRPASTSLEERTYMDTSGGIFGLVQGRFGGDTSWADYPSRIAVTLLNPPHPKYLQTGLSSPRALEDEAIWARRMSRGSTQTWSICRVFVLELVILVLDRYPEFAWDPEGFQLLLQHCHQLKLEAALPNLSYCQYVL